MNTQEAATLHGSFQPDKLENFARASRQLRASMRLVVRLPRTPPHPERICWGCAKLCPTHDLACGNGTVRTPHPVELFGEDWEAMLEEQEDEAAHVSAEERPLAFGASDEHR